MKCRTGAAAREIILMGILDSLVAIETLSSAGDTSLGAAAQRSGLRIAVMTFTQRKHSSSMFHIIVTLAETQTPQG